MALDIDKIKIFLELYHHEYFSCVCFSTGIDWFFISNHQHHHHQYWLFRQSLTTGYIIYVGYVIVNVE